MVGNEEDEKLQDNGKSGQIMESRNKQNVLPNLSKKAAIYQITMSILANLSILSSGMGLGFPAITTLTLTNRNNPVYLTDEQSSWFASVTAILCPFGGLICGFTLEKFGRKKTLILVNIISIISWVIIGFSSETDSELLYIELLVARVLIGLGIGLSSSPASVYSAEICHQNLRGRLTLLTALMTGIGMLIVYTMGYLIPENWRLVAILSGVITLISMFLLYPVPESPSWLIGQNRTSEAEKILRFLRGVPKGKPNTSEVTAELNDLIQNVSKSRNAIRKESIFDLIKLPEVYKPLAIMITFFAFQQFSGIFIMIVYGARVATEAGVSIDPFLCIVFIGLTRVCTTCLMGYISDKFGRKPPAIFSGFGMAATMFSLSAYLWLADETENAHWLPVVLVIVFFFCATLGFLTLPFAMIAEIYPQKIRSLAAGITIFAGYTMSFAIVKCYPSMVNEMGPRCVFLFFGVVSLIGVGFVVFFLPETKGKSLLEIEAYFKGSKDENIDDIELQQGLKQ